MPFFFNSKLRANILFLIKLKFQIRSYCTTSATKVRQEGKIKISLRVFGEGRKPKGYDRLGEPTPLTPCSLENVPFLSRGKLWGSGESLNSNKERLLDSCLLSEEEHLKQPGQS